MKHAKPKHGRKSPKRRMVHPKWAAVDRYLSETILAEDPELIHALRAAEEGGLPTIQVSPAHGKMLHILARGCGAKRILEIGTLGGYSTIWLGRSLPRDGRLVTMELEPEHAEIARANLAHAGLSDRAEVRVGSALKLLPKLAREKPRPFDFCFIDANKDSSPEYFEWAVKLSRPGALIVVDNAVMGGAIVDPENSDDYVEGVRRLYRAVSRDARVSATAIQTVGERGHDGLLIAVVN